MLAWRRFAVLLILSATLSSCFAANGNAQEEIADVPDVVINDVNSRSGKDGWSLIWSDEFSGDAIDFEKWRFDLDCWGGGNDERQCYTDNTDNAAVKDGKLVITAKKQRSSGFALPVHMRENAKNPSAIKSQPFTSARLTTRGKASWRYGRIDVRAKLPQGQGTWPAIWMLPEENHYGTWAASGEIDIMEAVNLGVRCDNCRDGIENRVLGTLHFGGKWPDNKHSGTETQLPGAIDDFHTYSIVWEKDRFLWFVDGKPYAIKKPRDWFTSASDDPAAPFDRPFHLIMNLAIGGKWPEGEGLKGVSEKGFPKRMEIDFVRVWKCHAEPDSDASCMSKGID